MSWMLVVWKLFCFTYYTIQAFFAAVMEFTSMLSQTAEWIALVYSSSAVAGPKSALADDE